MMGGERTAACTSFIVSGKATKDGRPLMMKNRDTGTLSNTSRLIQGEKYRYIGLINAGDSEPEEVWAGHNEAGFAIMNTAAYNLNKKDQKLELEGQLMKRALEICATVKDFEVLLDTFRRPRCVDANFGVIDAQGGCAYFETGDYDYQKYDVNDAPEGYIVRTNHGLSGDPDRQQGVERYLCASDVMAKAAASGQLNVEYLLENVPRQLTHGLTHDNLYDRMPQTQSEPVMVFFRDYIPRYITSSCVLFQGVKPNEEAQHTISWTIVGHPLTTVAIPLMITSTGKLPKVVSPDEEGRAPLAEWGLKLKKRIFSWQRGNTGDYIDLSKLINKEGTGIWQKLQPVEKEVVARGQEVVAKVRKKKKYVKDLDHYYDWVDSYLTELYTHEFGL